MATPRTIRTLALQVLFELDARDGEFDPEQLDTELGESDRRKAIDLAGLAFGAREAADAEILELAPDWPPSRQPAVDRAILRLAHYEMTSGSTPAKAAVNEAVELAKHYSTPQSPAFVNGVLDKVLKRVLAGEGS